MSSALTVEERMKVHRQRLEQNNQGQASAFVVGPENDGALKNQIDDMTRQMMEAQRAAEKAMAAAELDLMGEEEELFTLDYGQEAEEPALVETLSNHATNPMATRRLDLERRKKEEAAREEEEEAKRRREERQAKREALRNAQKKRLQGDVEEEGESDGGSSSSSEDGEEDDSRRDNAKRMGIPDPQIRGRRPSVRGGRAGPPSRSLSRQGRQGGRSMPVSRQNSSRSVSRSRSDRSRSRSVRGKRGSAKLQNLLDPERARSQSPEHGTRARSQSVRRSKTLGSKLRQESERKLLNSSLNYGDDNDDDDMSVQSSASTMHSNISARNNRSLRGRGRRQSSRADLSLGHGERINQARRQSFQQKRNMENSSADLDDGAYSESEQEPDLLGPASAAPPNHPKSQQSKDDDDDDSSSSSSDDDSDSDDESLQSSRSNPNKNPGKKSTPAADEDKIKDKIRLKKEKKQLKKEKKLAKKLAKKEKKAIKKQLKKEKKEKKKQLKKEKKEKKKQKKEAKKLAKKNRKDAKKKGTASVSTNSLQEDASLSSGSGLADIDAALSKAVEAFGGETHDEVGTGDGNSKKSRKRLSIFGKKVSSNSVGKTLKGKPEKKPENDKIGKAKKDDDSASSDSERSEKSQDDSNISDSSSSSEDGSLDSSSNSGSDDDEPKLPPKRNPDSRKSLVAGISILAMDGATLEKDESKTSMDGSQPKSKLALRIRTQQMKARNKSFNVDAASRPMLEQSQLRRSRSGDVNGGSCSSLRSRDGGSSSNLKSKSDHGGSKSNLGVKERGSLRRTRSARMRSKGDDDDDGSVHSTKSSKSAASRRATVSGSTESGKKPKVGRSKSTDSVPKRDPTSPKKSAPKRKSSKTAAS